MNANFIVTKPSQTGSDITYRVKDIREQEKAANKLWTPSDFEAIDKLISKCTETTEETKKENVKE